jgi:hypothetical protein
MDTVGKCRNLKSDLNLSAMTQDELSKLMCNFDGGEQIVNCKCGVTGDSARGVGVFRPTIHRLIFARK